MTGRPADPAHAAIAREASGPPRAQAGRVRALDGLRGVAAMVVLMHHALLASAPKLAGAYYASYYEGGVLHIVPVPFRLSFDWLVTYTPLHIFWAGPEFVVVFFVLSGFVLSLPVARGARLAAGSYYPTRLLRLYLPVWAALVLAALLHVLVSHNSIPGASWWLDMHSAALSSASLRTDALLGFHAGDWGFTTVLWSLHWEVLFSLLLPALLLAPLRSQAVRGMLVALCLIALRYGGAPSELELAPFVLGVVLAFERERIESVALALRGHGAARRTIKVALGLACVCALSADWWTTSSVSTALIAIGACLAVLCALVIGPFRSLLESTRMQWLGKRAFSLYLVHEPLVVALGFALHGHVSPLVFVAIAASASLLLTALFFRFVEAPFHRIARDWGAACGRRVASLAPAFSARPAVGGSG
jgi:peptidoglycan/LPS O-acetylase OafA/YrhL